MTTEEWRLIPGTAYWASSWGRVESPFGKILKPSRLPTGYWKTSINIGAIRWKNIYIHTLVCRAFHGEAPMGKSQVRHLNDDKDDNSADNLAWGTPLENMNDAIKNGKCSRGDGHVRATLTDEQIAEIRRRHTAAKINGYVPNGFNPALAAEFGIHVGTLNGLVAPRSVLRAAEDRPIRYGYRNPSTRKRKRK